MATVFVNGISAKSGGGLSVLKNFLKSACKSDDEFDFVVAVSKTRLWRDIESPRVSFLELGYWSNTALIPFASTFILPSLAKRTGCDIVFNPGDVPLRTALPQVFLFDWPYAAYPESKAWRLSTIKDRLVRNVKLFLFRHLLSRIDIMVAQSNPLAERLRALYDLQDVRVVPNAVAIENLEGGIKTDFALGESFNLLCLSRYYSHKNIEVFLPVAQRIRDAGLNARIITTLSRSDGPGSVKFLDAVSERGLSDIIVNVGTVPMANVPSLYEQSDALLLPTLLESFSGTYVEAMYHGLPILTSDLDFAHGVCGDGAIYFDPCDDAAIFEAISRVISCEELRRSKIALAKERLESMPDWQASYRAFAVIFQSALGISRD